MTTIELPKTLKSVTVLKPMAVNKIRFEVNHTLITPEMLRRAARVKADSGADTAPVANQPK